MAYTTIDNPEIYHQTKIYTGDGNDDRDIVFDVTDTTMQPNFLWSARRDSGDNLSIYDSVRGDGKELRTAENGGQYDRTNNIQALNSNGFQVGDDGQVNASGGTYVSWAWKESADAGFDIVSYTGDQQSDRTVSHGLSAVPKFMIIKNISGAHAWMVYHDSLGYNSGTIPRFLQLNNGNAQNNGGTGDFPTDPTSSVFTVGNYETMNKNSDSIIAYVWAPKQGYSRFGKYSSNSNADGPFVYLGFKPAWLMIKCTSATEGWTIFDNKREPYNDGVMSQSNANNAGSEGTLNILFLSNGFKVLEVTGQTNKSGAHAYVYAAYAEAPFVNSNAVPVNAR